MSVGLLELAVSVACFIAQNRNRVLVAVALLSTNFLAYRIGLMLINYRKPCLCMGSLTDAIHLSPQRADLIMKVTLGYLLTLSYASLYFSRRKSAAGGHS
jgi:hypothetical protein